MQILHSSITSLGSTWMAVRTCINKKNIVMIIIFIDNNMVLQLAYYWVVEVFAFHMIIDAPVGTVIDLGLIQLPRLRHKQLLYRIPE